MKQRNSSNMLFAVQCYLHTVLVCKNEKLRSATKNKAKSISNLITHQDLTLSCYYYRNFPICIESILLEWHEFNQILFSGSIPLFTLTNIIEIAGI